MSTTRRGNIVAFKGFIDERLEFALALEAGVTGLDFREVIGLNSLGVQHFFEFVQRWGGRPYEYFECPVILMDTFIMIPSLCGPEQNTAKIRSLFVPLECLVCHTEINILVEAKSLTCQHGLVVPEPRPCAVCGGSLTLQEVAHNYADLFKIGALTSE